MFDAPLAPSQRPDSGLSDDWELLLMRMRYREGKLISMPGNQPMLLDDPRYAYIIYRGMVDIFLVHIDEQGIGAHDHLFSVGPGNALFGQNVLLREVGLLARGAPDNEVIRIDVARLVKLGQQAEFTPIISQLIDGWVVHLQNWLINRLPPRDYRPIAANRATNLEVGEIARPHGKVVWTQHVTGSSYINARRDIDPLTSETPTFPLAPSMWLESAGETTLRAIATAEALGREKFVAELNSFNQSILVALTIKEAHEAEAERGRLERRARADSTRVGTAFSDLAAVVNPTNEYLDRQLDSTDPLFESATRVGRVMGITIKPYPDLLRGRQIANPLEEIARASRVRIREVLLRDDWYRHDNGPLVAFMQEDNKPVALLPISSTRYVMFDPLTNNRRIVGRGTAARLAPRAYTFYRPLPDRPLTPGDLLRFGLAGTRSDLIMLLLMGLIGGVLGLAPAIATAYLFNTLIPEAQVDRLWLIATLLALVALAAGVFEVVRGIALKRVEARVDYSVQAAIMDRVLKLPVSFFRHYSAGDLGERTLAFNTIRQTLSRTATTTVLLVAFSIFQLILLFVYSWQLALVGLALVLLFGVLVSALSVAQMRWERTLADLRGRISGQVLQYINGIAKFRVAGAEERAFAAWAANFAQQRRMAFRARVVGNQLSVFNAMYPLLSMMALFGVTASVDSIDLSVGNFLAFYTAFNAFLLASISFTGSLRSVLSVIPSYERARPILETEPEVDAYKADPGELSGQIEVSHVSFRYDPSLAPVLKDISLSIRSGEFVALVGPSGCGKSTLLRLLLGFDLPEAGSIYYDGQDLATLDIGSVRRQIGVVLQDGRLMTGSIYQNIVGAANLDLDLAWEAAERVGLADDIKRMPMGMYTWISEGGGNFSGGQKQRLLIARALVNKPRMLYLDEATSALDNRSQEAITQALNDLDATRVVVAHRLSTIRQADRIYVVDAGRIVQTGRYEDLIAIRGLFADLAQRQLL